MYKIKSSETGLVWNRYGNVNIAPKKGDAMSMYKDTGSADQRFDMVYDATGTFVYFRLSSNPKLVVNRHSKTGALMLWPLAESTQSDILFNTETVDGKMRLIMPEYKEYVTASSKASGANLFMQSAKKDDGSQFFQLVDEAAGVGDLKNVLAVPCSNQMAWGSQYCLATCVLDIENYYSPGMTMEKLIAGKYVQRSNGYVLTSSFPSFRWTDTGYGAAESAYCMTITDKVNQGTPVVVKMSLGSADHYVVAVTGGTTPDEIKVNDPADGKQKTLRQAFSRKGQRYQYLRIATKK